MKCEVVGLEFGRRGKGVRLAVASEENGRVCSWSRTDRVYPREPGAKARLPVRHEFHCEAPAGVADPVTTWPGGVSASTQEGG